MKNIILAITALVLSACGSSVMECNDEDVTSLVSELAIDIYNEENNPKGVSALCNQFNTSMLFIQGVDCSVLYSKVYSDIFYADQVKVTSVRTTSSSKSGIQYCAADLEYIFNDRDMVSLVKNYFINASISEELRKDLTDSLTTAWKEAFEATTVMTSGAYDVQVTDDGESFYVNLEIDEIPIL